MANLKLRKIQVVKTLGSLSGWSVSREEIDPGVSGVYIVDGWTCLVPFFI